MLKVCPAFYLALSCRRTCRSWLVFPILTSWWRARRTLAACLFLIVFNRCLSVPVRLRTLLLVSWSVQSMRGIRRRNHISAASKRALSPSCTYCPRLAAVHNCSRFLVSFPMVTSYFGRWCPFSQTCSVIPILLLISLILTSFICCHEAAEVIETVYHSTCSMVSSLSEKWGDDNRNEIKNWRIFLKPN